ncbi:MAG: sigma-54-dependent Fis family transcriptional regulator [Calditrichaeota bacterium]|nr:sigma-54-dependent Fis family transcriptional regulator [Calditrichota bacterium]RQW03860.1 MAG: sigma-54-dependent Fis family transcriptional regulator [Calditrichota bacterium]
MDNPKKILIVEDNIMWAESYRRWIGDDYDLQLAFNKTDALERFGGFMPDLIILDLGLPNIEDGLKILDEFTGRGHDSKIIVVTSFKDHQYALDAQRRGAYSYFSKGENIEEELPHLIKQALRMLKLERENSELRSRLKENYQYDNIVAISHSMQQILNLIEKIKDSSEPVLITGESGVGKEVIARHIHERSGLDKQKFVAINCAALPANLLESELFGYEKGAFTGAYRTTRGKLELGQDGFVFLDEIAEMPPEIQAKLLRVLEQKKFFRLGGEKEIETNFRLITATNKHLPSLIENRKFREDLFYRINVIPIHIPPLRERPDDIPALIHHFMENFCEENNLALPHITSRTVAFLSHLRWEGNVRELENLLKRLIITGNETIDIADLPPDLIEQSDNFLDKALANELTLEEISRIYVKMVLEQKNNNKKEACKLLNINYRTLMAKLKG